ncbi:MAG: GTP 3',8-cyclase [Phycisphaerae bacterium]|nr:GTP 3',8-cyclase [Phycisphaerae bacterium]
MLADATGRIVRYLRLSLTPDCPMRCVYCRPVGHARPAGGPLLTADEIELLVGHLVTRHGLRKVRLTGGDPTSRPELLSVIRRLAGLGLADLAMTTHGLTLASQAQAYARAGLRRVNVSLDSLDRAQFRQVTGMDGVARVAAGIDAAIAAGLSPLKINTVVMDQPHQPRQDLCRLLRFAADRDVEIRFIELMPMGPQAARWSRCHVAADEIRRRLAPAVVSWHALARGSESARRFRVVLDDGRSATVGLIAAMSCPFCAMCDRLRIGSSGTIQPCLMGPPAGSLLASLRPRFDGDLLDELLSRAMAAKAPVHASAGPGIMTQIGG